MYIVHSSFLDDELYKFTYLLTYLQTIIRPNQSKPHSMSAV